MAGTKTRKAKNRRNGGRKGNYGSASVVRGNKMIPDYESAYPSLPRDKASVLEESVRAEYEISDWVDPENPNGYPGWRVVDRTTREEILYTPNSRSIITKEYLRKDDLGVAQENILDLFARVAVNIATAEKKYDKRARIEDYAKRFARRMIHREFVPNTPTLANAGGHLQQLAACFGMILEDYLGTDDIGEDPEKQGNGIFDILRYGAMIQKSGGGTGYNFSFTRPKNSGIATTGGRASGPVSWLKVFNGGTEEINQGGFRRGANMGVLEYWHPDIFKFFSAKMNYYLSFFNLSMGTDEKFWQAFERNENFFLISPKDMKTVPVAKRILTSKNLLGKSAFEKMDEREQADYDPSLLLDDDKKTIVTRYTGKKVGFVDDNGIVNISARATLEYAAEMAHRIGCPGVIFFDTMNRDNPTPHVGEIKVVNPCGEQPLLNFEACNLGSANLYSCVEDVKVPSKGLLRFGRVGDYFYGRVIGEGDAKVQRRINLRILEGIVVDSVNFLDNVIDMGKYPFKKVYSQVKGNRKIGLGVMGVAETAMALGINYESEDMEALGAFVSSFMYEKAFEASSTLAEKRGVFPNWKGSIYDPRSPFAKNGKNGKIRNATLLTVAPNGTTGQAAGISGGIEPMFGIYWQKNLANGKTLKFRNPLLFDELKRRGLYTEDLVERIKEERSIQRIDEIPEDMKRRYKTATEVDPIWHVRIQGAFQNGINGIGIDNAVSKTVNLPADSTPEDFLNIFVEARKRGCKGITGYRDGSIKGQPLTIERKEKSLLEKIVRVYVPIISPAVSVADNTVKYRVERGEDVFHLIFNHSI